MKSFSRFAVPAVFVLLLGGLLYAFLIRPMSRHEEADTEASAARVDRGDIVDRLRFTGQIFASRTIPVFSEASGQVIKVHVQEGDRVKKGDLLLEIDKTQLMNDLETQNLNLKKSEISLRGVRDDLVRKEELFQNKFIPETELIEAKKLVELAQVDYDLAKKRLDSLHYQLGKIVLAAPADGIVTAKKVEEGEVIASMAESSQGKMLLTITDTSEKSIDVRASEADRVYLREGMPVEFWLDSNPSRKYSGKITKIAAAASKEGDQTFFPFQIRIEEDTEALSLGISVRVELVARESRGVLRVPNRAVFHEGGADYVFVPKGAGVEKKGIRKGVSNAEYIEVLEGLKEGEPILLERPVAKP